MIYIVEDDDAIRELEQYALQSNGYEVASFASSEPFWQAMRTEAPELVILDVMLPGVDGIELLQRMKASAELRTIPVVMATAKGAEYDKIQSLDLGADDYLVKPFEMKEVLARIEAVLRRSGIEPEKSRRRLEFDKLIIDMDAFELTVDGKKVPTPPKEMELLYHLAAPAHL